MEDDKFDDIIKKKLGDYEALGFDPTALSALHQKVEANVSIPWYQKYRYETIAAIMTILISLAIVGSQWHWNNQVVLLLENENKNLRKQLLTIEQLQDELIRLKKQTPDTVRIIQKDNSPRQFLYKSLSSDLPEHYLGEGEKEEHQVAFLKLRADGDIPAEIISLLEKKGMLSKEEGYIYIKLTGETKLVPLKIAKQIPENPLIKFYLSSEEPNQEDQTERKKIIPLSIKTVKELDKHYRKGLGIRIGPVIELLEGNSEAGEVNTMLALGFVGDFLLSPHLSLELGMKYSERVITLEDPEQQNQLSLKHWDKSVGTLQEVEIDSKVVEFPFNIKYHHPLSSSTSLIGGVGISGYLYMNQEFEYSYSVSKSHADPGLSIISDYTTDSWSLYPGSINFLGGFSRQLPNNKILETTIYYQKGIGETGDEGTRADYYGLRAVYWFRVR